MKYDLPQGRYRLSTLLALGALLTTSTQSSLAQDATAGGDADDSKDRAGVMIYVDPETGEWTAPPPDKEIRPPVAGALSQSAEGLVEKPGPAGGVMVDLKGRFQSSVIAVPRPDGGVTVEHGELPQTDNEGTK